MYVVRNPSIGHILVLMMVQRFIKVITVHPEENMNVWTNPSICCGDISVCIDQKTLTSTVCAYHCYLSQIED